MRILHNARIYAPTAAGGQPVTALAIQAGRIVAMGQDHEVLGLAPSGSLVEDLHGQTVWPGLTDAHIHLDYYAQGLRKVDCEVTDRDECLRRVQERAQNTPPGQWIFGHGWNQNDWSEGFGDPQALDRAAPHHPVYLTAKSLHAAWANQKALEAAGITAQTTAPNGGIIQRDEHGQPTGYLFESAMALVEAVLPEVTADEVAVAIEAALPTLWSMGITGVHDFDQPRCFAALQMLRERGALQLRVTKSIPQWALPHAAELGLRSGFGDEFLRIGSVKLFADGALGPQTAAMLQPYEGTQDSYGMLLLDEEEIFEIGRQAAQSGLGLAIHAIGDKAVHEVLSAYRHLRQYEEEQNLPKRRHRVEHVQVIHPTDLGQFAELGVIASMQPIHAPSDMYVADRFWRQRARYAYAWQTLNTAQAALAFGSDAPVESPNPFWGLHAAVTRTRRDGSPQPDGWYPQERLALETALAGFTTGAAFAAGREHELGQLSPGYLADLIVLEQDPFTIAPADLFDLQPTATMVAGEWAWKQGHAND